VTSHREYKPSAPTLYLAFELGASQWKLGFSAGLGSTPLLRTVKAGDLLAVSQEIGRAKQRLALPAKARVLSCYEAGRDGFWLHRALVKVGIENLIVDSSSIEVNRRQRRAKTDRLDAARLLDLLVRHDLGTRKVWSVVHVPSPEQEDARQLHREMISLKCDRTRLVNRVRGLLFSQGIRVPRVDAELDLDALRDWQGQSILAGLRQRLRAELAHLATVHRRILDLEAQRRQLLKLRDERSEALLARLMRLRSLGANISWLLVHELFAWRNLRNRRQVGALAGLAPTPYASGDTARERGISKAGIRSVRHYAVELAWLWLHFQPRSQLARWYQRRFAKGSSRLRRIGIVALARKLLIALWRYLEFDELPKGAVLKAA
jgi:transposase